MVYGLNVRPEWGFDPKVDWEGKNEPPRDIPALEPVNDGGVGGAGRLGGIAVDGTNFPKWVKWTDPNGNPVPDFDNTPHLNVSERTKQIIESLEPGVHQFFPVEYQDKRGNPTGIRYWFNACNRLDSVDRQHSNMVLHRGWEWTSPKNVLRSGSTLPNHIDVSKPAKIVFNLQAIGDHHIWVDKHITSSIWISSKAADLFRSEGLTGLRLSESGMETVG